MEPESDELSNPPFELVLHEQKARIARNTGLGFAAVGLLGTVGAIAANFPSMIATAFAGITGIGVALGSAGWNRMKTVWAAKRYWRSAERAVRLAEDKAAQVKALQSTVSVLRMRVEQQQTGVQKNVEIWARFGVAAQLVRVFPFGETDAPGGHGDSQRPDDFGHGGV